jgi:hypothetical protein
LDALVAPPTPSFHSPICAFAIAMPAIITIATARLEYRMFPPIRFAGVLSGDTYKIKIAGIPAKAEPHHAVDPITLPRMDSKAGRSRESNPPGKGRRGVLGPTGRRAGG